MSLHFSDTCINWVDVIFRNDLQEITVHDQSDIFIHRSFGLRVGGRVPLFEEERSCRSSNGVEVCGVP